MVVVCGGPVNTVRRVRGGTEVHGFQYLSVERTLYCTTLHSEL